MNGTTNSRRSFLATLVPSLLLVALGAAASPDAASALGSAKLDFDSNLQIGHDLEIEVKNGQPFTTYRSQLLDDYSSIVVELDITTDSKGRGSATLWRRAGLAGCDCADPDVYRYETYGEATLKLFGRQFSVELFAPNGFSEDLQAVDLLVNSTETFFWTVLDGCEKVNFEPEETVYLEGFNVPSGVEVYTVYLIEAPEEPLEPGTELEDVRAAYSEKPQKVQIPEGIESFTEQISVGDELPEGPYTAILRPEESDGFTLTENSRTTRTFYIGRTQEHCSWGKGEEPPSP